jgi:hypothetical protein
MYIGASFEALEACLVGYSLGVRASTGVDLMAQLGNYVKECRGVEFAVTWPRYVLREVAHGDQESATEIVLETITSFAVSGYQ